MVAYIVILKVDKFNSFCLLAIFYENNNPDAIGPTWLFQHTRVKWQTVIDSVIIYTLICVILYVLCNTFNFIF